MTSTFSTLTRAKLVAAGLVIFAVCSARAEDAAAPHGWGAVAPILDKHCARCHGAVRKAARYKERPAGDFGFVLDEPELVKRHKLVPGNADASEIFTKIVKGDMPKDADDACFDGSATDKTYCGLTTDEKATLHDAINALPAAQPEAPAVAQAFVTDRDVIRMIADDVAKATSTDAAHFRYLTFTHLLNIGEPEANLKAYRLGLTKLLNSLSTNSDPFVPVAIDPGQSVLRIDLRRLGWTSATWDGVVAADPYVMIYNDAQFHSVQQNLGTVAPFVRADWFAFAASRPPLYYAILDLPHTRAELQARLGVDAPRDFADRQVERAGFQLSGVSDNNRMVERHAISTGAYWESFDFGANGDRKSLFQFPLGPPGAFGALSDRFGFNQDGGEIIFNLPNGFHGYYLTDGRGNRLDVGPTRIVRDPSQRDSAVTPGISCMSCHDKGIKFNDRRPGQPLDQTRDFIDRSGTYPSEVKELVDAIFPRGEDFNHRLESDAKHYADALAAADVNVNTKLEGVELVNALSKRFEDNLDAKLAAAEVGLSEAAFLDRLDAAGGPSHDLKLRLAQDVVPRDQFVALFAQLVNTINDKGDKAVDLAAVTQGTATPGVAVKGHKAPQTSKTFDLAFYANTTTLRVGDLVTFALRSEQPCFLSLVDSDDKGRSAVLFPNSFHPDGRIAANTTIDIPGPAVGGFKLRAPESGTERITAVCNASFPDFATPASGGAPFTTFGSTRDLLAAQADERASQQKRLTRLLVVEKGEGPLARPGVTDTGAQPNTVPGETGTVGSQLISNPIEPAVPITAQKSVILSVR